MKKAFKPAEVEQAIYESWEKNHAFVADPDSEKEPFSILLPPPNANADLHVGHAMFIYEDILIRYNKLIGKEVLWLPGADHAGFETQFVYEKHLAKKGQSRFDFDRETLFKNIWDFVMENKGVMENQLRRLGFALDWEKNIFTMDPEVVKIVYDTFERMFNNGLIYRDTQLVNYCVKNGTSFSDLEVEYVDQETSLWHIQYGPITVATTRPETMPGDVAVAVHPNDERYKELIGKTVTLPLQNREIPVIADDAVDPEFGTGAVKVTPAHDPIDWAMEKKHKLPIIQVIGFNGRMTDEAGEAYKGLKFMEAREKVIEALEKEKVLVKTQKYINRVGTCYKCGTVLQPLPKEQWFIKVRGLADRAVELVNNGEITIYPKRFTKKLTDWLENFHDWNISRQIVWGIRIPAYKCETGEWFASKETPQECKICGKCNFIQDEDVFDTWFSSSQWPFVTLMAQKNNNDKEYGKKMYEKFYPTTVMETGYEILPIWVARMIMISEYVTGTIPFKSVFLHGMVRDKKGQKMSKSKGNVVNPMDMIDKYGADALRASLIFQSKEGGDVAFNEDKIVGMRNYANKVWNIGRFISLGYKQEQNTNPSHSKKILSELEKEYASARKSILTHIDSWSFSLAFNELYEFIWHRLADYYIEQLKEDVRSGNIESLEALKKVYSECMVLLHPFMPFLTEAVWKEFNGDEATILNESLY